MLREIDADNAADYLRETGRAPTGKSVAVHALGGGVSNVVLKIEVEGEPPFVLKQSRERLRTQAHWVSRLDRIWTERDALALLGEVLPPGRVPEVLFADEANSLFAMSWVEAPGTWKERLLAGRAEADVAQAAADLLGAMHAETVGHPALDGRLDDTEVFDQLRIDPYYRTIARAHPDVAPRIDELIAGLKSPAERTFVHADFSPKNLLVHDRRVALVPGEGLFTLHGQLDDIRARGVPLVTAVDFETAHAGDPSFDLGFFLSHLILKAFRAGPESRAEYQALIPWAWSAYFHRLRPGFDPDRPRLGLLHAAACCLARVDGKSPVEYLDEPRRAAVRRFARAALLEPPRDLLGLLEGAVREMHE